MKRLLAILLLALCIVPAIEARHMSDLKIYINPGHGGYTSNDRPIRIHPFEQNDTNGYWESTTQHNNSSLLYPSAAAGGLTMMYC